jgi:hypothetical protein
VIKLLSMRRSLEPPMAAHGRADAKLAPGDRFPDTLENMPEVNGPREMLD